MQKVSTCASHASAILRTRTNMKTVYLIGIMITLIETPMLCIYYYSYPAVFQRVASSNSRPGSRQLQEHAYLSTTKATANFQYVTSDNLKVVTEALDAPSKKTSRMKSPEPLAPSVIERIKIFVFFVGIPRSGHSIVAALLDSHPHIVISNELDIFNEVNLSDFSVTKSSLFNDIWNTSYRKARSSLRGSGKGYSLAINGLYQGAYQSYIDVIGDKKGGKTTSAFLANNELFQNHLNKLRTLVNLPIKVIHVIRNPYDNIATLAIYEHFHRRRTDVAMTKRSNKTININPEMMDNSTHYYFNLYRGSEVMRQKFNLDIMDVHGKDLIANPKVMINKMCDFLQVPCSDDYLDIVSRKMFSSESKTRYNVKWTDKHIAKIKENIQKYDSLRQYLNFDS